MAAELKALKSDHHCHCDEHALEMANLPDAALLKPWKFIPGFFSPIKLNEVKYSFTETGGTWKAVFYSKQDMEMALVDKQWQYLDGQCIRLSTVDKPGAAEEKQTWASIPSGLRLDILAHFHLSRLPRLRRVCKSWMENLLSLEKRKSSQLLYFEVKILGVTFEQTEEELTKMLKDIRAKSKHVSGHVKRVIFKVVDIGAMHLDEILYLWNRQNNMLDTYLEGLVHLDTVVFSGSTIAVDLDPESLLNGPRWPRSMTLVFHKCRFAFPHYFPKTLIADDDSAAAETAYG